jgi:ADP-heptose:LPS heptosyltransferase
MHAPRRILVVKLATLGDMLTATPALRALRATFETARIGVLTTAIGAAALRGLDSFDELLEFDKYAFDAPASTITNLGAAVKLARRLTAGRWDVLLLLHHLTTPFGVAKYAALAFGSGARLKIGLDNGRGRWFLDQAAVDRGFGWRHEVDYWLDVVGVLGARHPGQARLELCLAPHDLSWADGHAQPDAVLIGPGSGAYSTARRWPAERFVEVARALEARHGLRPLVLAGTAEDEQQLASHIAQALGAPLVPPAPSPQALGALIKRSKLLVANDSGPVHIATAVGTPVVAIFGPSNDRAWGPYPTDDPRHQVAREIVACAPCIHRGHEFGTPQGCPARTCLAILEPEQVIEAAERALGVGSARETVAV